MEIADIIISYKQEHPRATAHEIAAYVKTLVPEANTSAASVSSTLSRAGKRSGTAGTVTCVEKRDGLVMLREATQRHGIHLVVLIAETSLWANPEVHRRLLAQNGTGVYFPNTRRRRSKEQRRQMCGTDFTDDNSAANRAIKQAVGMAGKLDHFEACHIWPETCYDARYHTMIANLVLIPRPLAGLSDHDPEVQAALQFRAFELYDWHPTSTPPKKPSFYPTMWHKEMPFTEKIAKAIANRKLTYMAGNSD